MNNIGKRSYKGRCDRWYFRSTTTHHGIFHYLPGSQAPDSPEASCVNTRDTGYLYCFLFKHFALFGFAESKYGAVSLASTKHTH